MRFSVSLTENHRFQALYRRGKRAEGQCMVIYTLPVPKPRPSAPPEIPAPSMEKHGCRPCRLGLTVSKKLGCAVRRNRCRRRLKEAYRLMEADIRSGWDIVIVARGRAYDAPFAVLQREMETLLHRLSLVRKDKP